MKNRRRKKYVGPRDKEGEPIVDPREKQPERFEDVKQSKREVDQLALLLSRRNNAT